MLDKTKLLIVDDDDDIRELLYLFLDNKYNIIQANSGNEAFKIIEHQDIDIILTDISMRNGDGISLIQQVILLPIEQQPVICTLSAIKIKDQIEESTFNLLNKYIFKQYLKPFNLKKLTKDLSEIEEKEKVA